MNRRILSNGKLVLPNQILQSDILIENGIIVGIGNFAARSDDKIIDLKGKYVMPGFIDIHTHGAATFDFTLGTYQESTGSFQRSESMYLQGLSRALQSYISTGCTSIYITTMAAPISQILQSARYLQNAHVQNIPGIDIVQGINLEGTFIKMPQFAGAQNPEFFYPPDYKLVEALQNASGNQLKIVNIPPEHGSKGLDMIRYLGTQGIVVSGGHTGADGDMFDRAVQAGLQIGVHFLNGPSRSSSKIFQSGGAVESMLRSDSVFLELIMDGYHVHPAYVRDVIARKQTDRIIAITDSMFATGMETLNQFELLDLRGKVSTNRAYLHAVDKDDTLFGSVLTMDKGFANVLNWMMQPMEGVWYRIHEAKSLQQALIENSWFFSRNPARAMGIYNSTPGFNGTGSIELGKWADLIITDLIKKDGGYNLCIEQTLCRGAYLTQGLT